MTRLIASVSSAKNSRLDQRSRCQRAAHSLSTAASARSTVAWSRAAAPRRRRQEDPADSCAFRCDGGRGAGRSDGFGAAVWGRPAGWRTPPRWRGGSSRAARSLSHRPRSWRGIAVARIASGQARHRRGPTYAKHSKRPRRSGASVSGRSWRFTARRDQAGTLPALDEGPLTADAGLRAVARKA